MKQPKKPTRSQKETLARCNLNPNMWMVQYEDYEKIIFVNKINGQTREKRKV